jgi:ubiquinone/menaquinone biosynthesis C-methylase UbiE
MFEKGNNDNASPDKVTIAVKNFYERYHFPGIRPTDQDGLILIRRLSRLVAQHRQDHHSKCVRVLDAGCGTGNTIVSLSQQFPDVEFLGVDISEPSLARAKEISTENNLKNIRFSQWDLMLPFKIADEFDVILCLGVLHHTANMQTVLSNLDGVLKRNGEFYLWIYGIHGRYRHSLNQRLLRMLLEVDPEPVDPVDLAREFVHGNWNAAILQDLCSQDSSAPTLKQVLNDPAWIADQFLHPHEILLNMETLITVIQASGFELVKWLGIREDISSYFSSKELTKRFQTLPPYHQLIALDLLLKPDRYFVVIKKSA